MMTMLTVTLIGKVNAGKSLLCNRLLRQDIASVKPVAGWTREVSVYPLASDVELADTPGLDDVDDAVAGKTFDFVGRTDLFLHVVNADEGLTRSVHDAHQVLCDTGKPVILICNKADHLDASERRAVAEQLAANLPSDRLVVTSARTGDGIEDLAREIWNVLASRGDELRYQRLVKVRIAENDARLQRASDEADSSIRWATGRAALIAVVPIPLADVYPLILNEIYMAKKIGEAYGLTLGDSVIKGLVAAMGASFVGLVIASFFPGVKIFIAGGVTYGVGKAVKAWCESGCTLSDKDLRREYKRHKRDYKPREGQE